MSQSIPPIPENEIYEVSDEVPPSPSILLEEFDSEFILIEQCEQGRWGRCEDDSNMIRSFMYLFKLFADDAKLEFS